MVKYESMLIEGKFFRTEFGFPCKDFKDEPDPSRPLTPITGKVLIQGKWIEGSWTPGGQVIALQYDVRWSLVEITKEEYCELLEKHGNKNYKNPKVSDEQLELFQKK